MQSRNYTLFIIKRKENKMYNKLLLITPLGMNKHLNEVLTTIHRWGEIGNTIREKRVIVNEELAEKHFNYLPKDALIKVVNEWSGSKIIACIIASCPEDAQQELMYKVYISPDEKRAERDLKLWFPEYFIE